MKTCHVLRNDTGKASLHRCISPLNSFDPWFVESTDKKSECTVEKVESLRFEQYKKKA